MIDPDSQPVEHIRESQWQGLQRLLDVVLASNSFYRERFRAAGLAASSIRSIDDFQQRVPLTLKAELSLDQDRHPPYGSNLTFSADRYTRLHQTSSTSGKPLRWLDIPADWEWLLGGWRSVLDAAGVTAKDRVFAAFSFGPFIGFWMAFEAALELGCLCIPGGAMNSVTRLRAILANRVTVLLCTPTYAIRLGETARSEGIGLASASVRTIVVAGEPGGSVPAVRARIKSLWPNARVFDHHGMTEVGPVTFECPERPGVLHVMESRFLAEVVEPTTGKPSHHAGVIGELVLTPLGRLGMPVLRYRTGDLVRLLPPGRCQCGRTTMALEGGILARADDMIFIRGVNLFPGAVDEIIHSCDGVAEYRIEISERQGLTEMCVIVEPDELGGDPAALCDHIAKAFRDTFNLRVPVTLAESGTLPRWELKARRWIRRGGNPLPGVGTSLAAQPEDRET